MRVYVSDYVPKKKPAVPSGLPPGTPVETIVIPQRSGFGTDWSLDVLRLPSGDAPFVQNVWNYSGVYWGGDHVDLATHQLTPAYWKWREQGIRQTSVEPFVPPENTRLVGYATETGEIKSRAWAKQNIFYALVREAVMATESYRQAMRALEEQPDLCLHLVATHVWRPTLCVTHELVRHHLAQHCGEPNHALVIADMLLIQK
jgi:hypothetical protein